ncbi:MAG: hypothetical protein AVDCRST_MAG18-3467, partial [uncultured Thermomicrobiales bacterium]
WRSQSFHLRSGTWTPPPICTSRSSTRRRGTTAGRRPRRAHGSRTPSRHRAPSASRCSRAICSASSWASPSPGSTGRTSISRRCASRATVSEQGWEPVCSCISSRPSGNSASNARIYSPRTRDRRRRSMRSMATTPARRCASWPVASTRAIA